MSSEKVGKYTTSSTTEVVNVSIDQGSIQHHNPPLQLPPVEQNDESALIYNEFIKNNQDFTKTIIDSVKCNGLAPHPGRDGRDLFEKINFLIRCIITREHNFARTPFNDYDEAIKKCIDNIIKFDQERRNPEKRFAHCLEDSSYRQVVIEDNSSLLHYAVQLADLRYVGNVIRYLVNEKGMDPIKRNCANKKPVDYVTEDRFPGCSKDIRDLLDNMENYYISQQSGPSSNFFHAPCVQSNARGPSKS